jgi:hypothetical protein
VIGIAGNNNEFKWGGFPPQGHFGTRRSNVVSIFVVIKTAAQEAPSGAAGFIATGSMGASALIFVIDPIRVFSFKPPMSHKTI